MIYRSILHQLFPVLCPYVTAPHVSFSIVSSMCSSNKPWLLSLLSPDSEEDEENCVSKRMYRCVNPSVYTRVCEFLSAWFIHTSIGLQLAQTQAHSYGTFPQTNWRTIFLNHTCRHLLRNTFSEHLSQDLSSHCMSYVGLNVLHPFNPWSPHSKVVKYLYITVTPVSLSNTWLTLSKVCSLVKFRHQNYLVWLRKIMV